MQKQLALLTVLSSLVGIGFAPAAHAVDVKFNFVFLDADADINGYFIIDDSVLPTIYNGGSAPVNDGLVDFTKIKELSLHYNPGELASGGGDFSLADYSSLRWTSYVPLAFNSDPDAGETNIAYQWNNSRTCDATAVDGVFSFGRAAGSFAPTAAGATCMAGSESDVFRVPSLLALFIDPTFVPPAIPEPSTYALMALGLGVIGLASRRRKS